ncbi:unnamed protein product [Ostreobium quekettii]|uniref:DUF1499 domain-containing protein n=1 Tax=Ostreobium quekettii TaxID=121088 RepID=A0A8S1JA44_9CHLO|nr:unnamed protein product [Ostreobium quekettii]|eukprot:evm.model.scf_1442.5 EVM.evm.TU.scf_1442.5   scf_1442:23486-25071(+)
MPLLSIPWNAKTGLAVAVGSGVLTCLLGWLAGPMAPIINDVSTDLENPPAFTTVQVGELSAAFKALIRAHYPDLQPQVFDSKDVPKVFETAVRVAKAQRRWTVVKEDAAAGTVEGYSVTQLMRFKDDWVVRVAELRGGGAVVDMRSRSRLGKGDLGANAARIRTFLAALKGELEAE